MKKLLYIAIAFCALFAAACNNNANNPIKDVSGRISDAEEGEEITIYQFVAGVGKNEIAKTTTDANGNFELQVNSDTISYFSINIGNKREQLLIIDNDLKIDAEKDPKGRFKVEGSSENTQLQGYLELENTINTEYRRIMKKIQGDQQAMVEEQKTFQDQANQDIKRYIDNKGVAFYVLFALQRMNLQKDYDYIMPLTETLVEKYPDSKDIQGLKKTMDMLKKQKEAEKLTAIGAVAPEISLPTPEGAELSLSSMKGKIVLVDFWAAWCAPCRAYNPKLVSLYDELKGKDFEILGVSLDKDKDKWLTAIEKDQLTWPQVSDLQFWDSEAARTYGIQSIPASILIDQDGKIVAKNLRGDALKTKIEELLAAKAGM
ncbi:peroxiredoxin family protein [Sediminitomix flava]|uniref:Peroxiredoxin n=1 Tax=Sediminitomix flava TaxID=379075 RepID=A0A315ZCU6_SEDFL|nr:TlpA disulfide reductase family protein [Sediminitomix flava]PWJ43405.1 peroxiredoxin [Sediminitomix flava]